MDLEKGRIEEAIGAPDAQIPAVAEGEEKEKLLLIPDLGDSTVIDGGVAAANMNPTGKKKWLVRCWLMVTGSVIFLTNHIYGAPKYQLMTPLELMVIFTVFIYAIFLVCRTMKQM